jgi:CHASE3 domain sensor protein
MALSVRARILLGFGLVLLMLVASAAVSTMLISGINTHFDEFQHALERKTEALKLELVMTETRVRVNQWLRSMNPFFAKGADDLLADSGGLLDQARAAAVNDQERETISGISRAQTAYIKSWHVVQQLYADGVKVYAEKLDAPAGSRQAAAWPMHATTSSPPRPQQRISRQPWARTMPAR